MSVTRLDDYGLDGLERGQLLAWALIVNTELLAVALYFILGGITLTNPLFAVYGLVWINVGAAVLYYRRPRSVSLRTGLLAGALAAGYFGLLAVAGGILALAPATTSPGAGIVALPPGWGPAVGVVTPEVGGIRIGARFGPARTVGYLALAALVYDAVVDAASSAAAGVLGLFSCVSCSWPVVAGMGASLVGGGSAATAAAAGLSYDLSTLVFLVTVALLWWRPLID